MSARVGELGLRAASLAGILAALTTAPAHAFVSFHEATSDGDLIVFATDERLIPADTDDDADLYHRNLDTATTELVSTGPANLGTPSSFHQFTDLNGDGTRVAFTTEDGLVEADTDGLTDVYERDVSTDITTLVSTGPTDDLTGESGGARYVDATNQLFFNTQAALLVSDGDVKSDAYVLAGGVLTLVSQGPGDLGTQDAGFAGVSDDGLRAFFTTAEPIIAADGPRDIYERNLGTSTTALLTTGTTQEVAFKNVSSNGSRVLFETSEGIVGGDSDAKRDVYETINGAPATLISTGPDDLDAGIDAFFSRASSDGADVIFTTNESLISSDTDTVRDVYLRSGAVTTHVSAGSINGDGPFDANSNFISVDGNRTFFSTDESLLAGDVDGARDVYRLDTTTSALARASVGENDNGPFDAQFAGALPDGFRIEVTSQEQMSFDDADTARDAFTIPNIAFRSSQGVINGNGPFPVSFPGGGLTSDGEFFTTAEQLMPEDADVVQDLYVGGFTAPRLISVDAIPPQTAITEGPSGPVRTTSVSFSFRSSDPGSSFECRLDGATFSECSSPRTFFGLAEGLHVFRVRATDAPGNVDPTPANRTFTVDTVAPDVTIDAAPPATTTSPNASFDYSADEPGVNFRCRLDGAAYEDCARAGKNFGGLADGRHVFRVRGVDRAGNVSDAERHIWVIT